MLLYGINYVLLLYMKSKIQKKRNNKKKSKKGGKYLSLYKILKEYKIAKDIDKKYGIPLAERQNCINNIDPIDAYHLKDIYDKCRNPLIEDQEFYNNYCKKANPFLFTPHSCIGSYAERFIRENQFYYDVSKSNRQKILEKDMKKVEARKEQAMREALESGVTNRMYTEMNQFYENILNKEKEQLSKLDGEHIDRHMLLSLFIAPEKTEILEDLYNGDKEEMTKDINELLIKFDKYIIGEHIPLKKETLFF